MYVYVQTLSVVITVRGASAPTAIQLAALVTLLCLLLKPVYLHMSTPVSGPNYWQ